MKCKECGEMINSFFGTCMGCGFVYNDKPIMYGEMVSDIDNENQEQEKSLSFIKSTSPDIGFFTTQDIKKTTNKELKRALLNAKRKPRLYGQPENAQRFYTAWTEINRICSALKLNNDVSEMAVIFVKGLMKRGFLERSYRKFACYAALVIMSARLQNRLPIRFSTVAGYSDETVKNIRKAYDNIRKELDITVKPFTLEEIVRYNCAELGIDEKECVRFANKVKIVHGRDLYGYSAGIIRFITKMPRMRISEVLRVSEPVITARAKEMRKYDL